MNLNLLSAFKDDWPDDTVVSKVDSFGSIFLTPSNVNVYSENLKINLEDGKILAEFAAANGMQYSSRSEIVAEGLDNTARAWPGNTTNTTAPILAHIIKGKLFGYDVRLYLAYIISSTQKDGETNMRLDKMSIIRVRLPKFLPQMVLESNKNDQSTISTMPSSFNSNQKLRLEGDFANYFDFFSPIGLQMNTLTVLAPNFMQILIDSANIFDVEFFGDEMILTTKYPLYSAPIMQKALQALEAELKYLDRLLLSWDYQPKQLPFDTLKKPFFKGETVKVGSLRFTPSTILLIVALCFSFFAVLSLFF